MLYTKIDNTSQTSNKDIKARYIKEYSQYKDSNRWLGLKIGQYLKDIYPNLITTGGGSLLYVIIYNYSQNLKKTLRGVL